MQTDNPDGIAHSGSSYSRSYECFPSAIVITNVPEIPFNSPVPDPGTTTTCSFCPLLSIVAICCSANEPLLPRERPGHQFNSNISCLAQLVIAA